MPRAPRTQLLLKREKLMKDIGFLQACVRLKEEELESLSDMVCVRGPFLQKGYKTSSGEYGSPVTQRNARNNRFTDQAKWQNP